MGSMPQPQTMRRGRQNPSARQIDTSTTHTGLCSVKMFSVVCFLHKTKKRNLIVENTMLGCIKYTIQPMFWAVLYLTVIVEHIDIIDHYHCSENLYFSVAFLDEVMG
jgi:hypothetical protein